MCCCRFIRVDLHFKNLDCWLMWDLAVFAWLLLQVCMQLPVSLLNLRIVITSSSLLTAMSLLSIRVHHLQLLVGWLRQDFIGWSTWDCCYAELDKGCESRMLPASWNLLFRVQFQLHFVIQSACRECLQTARSVVTEFECIQKMI